MIIVKENQVILNNKIRPPRAVRVVFSEKEVKIMKTRTETRLIKAI